MNMKFSIVTFGLVLSSAFGFCMQAKCEDVAEEVIEIQETMCWIEDFYSCAFIVEEFSLGQIQENLLPESSRIGCGSECHWSIESGVGVACSGHTQKGIIPTPNALIRTVVPRPIIDSPPNHPPGSVPGSGRTDWDNAAADLVTCYSTVDCAIACQLKEGRTDRTKLENFECVQLDTEPEPHEWRESIAEGGSVCTGDKASGPQEPSGEPEVEVPPIPKEIDPNNVTVN